MKITEEFIGEHAVFYPQLGLLERATATYATAGEARSQAALLAAALKSHAALEEELLFIEMESLPEAGDPIAAMRSEHLDIEASLSRACETDDLKEARDLLLHVVDVARPHFAKEEDVLFPLAEQLLDEGTLLELGDRWAGRRLGGAVRSGAAFAGA